MITIQRLTGHSFDVTQLGEVHEDDIITVIEALHAQYPGQSELIVKANGFRAGHKAEDKALELVGIDGFAAGKQLATGKIVF